MVHSGETPEGFVQFAVITLKQNEQHDARERLKQRHRACCLFVDSDNTSQFIRADQLERRYSLNLVLMTIGCLLLDCNWTGVGMDAGYMQGLRGREVIFARWLVPTLVPMLVVARFSRGVQVCTITGSSIRMKVVSHALRMAVIKGLSTGVP